MGNFIVLKLLDMAIIGNIIKGVIEAKEAFAPFLKHMEE